MLLSTDPRRAAPARDRRNIRALSPGIRRAARTLFLLAAATAAAAAAAAED